MSTGKVNKCMGHAHREKGLDHLSLMEKKKVEMAEGDNYRTTKKSSIQMSCKKTLQNSQIMLYAVEGYRGDIENHHTGHSYLLQV